MIEAAAIVSAVIGQWDDFAIITGLLFFNAALEFWQDRKASNALAALKKGLAPEATAMRAGNWQTVTAATLVPGDIVKIRLGALCPSPIGCFRDPRFVAGLSMYVNVAFLQRRTSHAVGAVRHASLINRYFYSAVRLSIFLL
jgi:hypothetical protein